MAATVRILDEEGYQANERFLLRAPELSGLSAVDGTGKVAPNSSGSASWVIILTDEAAPQAPAVYKVGGSFSYTQDGTVVTVPLTPVSITVRPDAALDIKYFHQRDVIADDPFTTTIEPSIPYSLVVMVQNKGFGAARSLSLSSPQPNIVDNNKGLLIDFKLVGAEINGQQFTPTLSANFGSISPGKISIAKWLFTSSLQGLFTDYKATFQHLDDLGSTHLSTIKNVEIHEMIHLVQAPGAFEDNKPDFLVNDIPDSPYDLPDTLYFSDGTTNPVAAVTSGMIVGVLSPTSLIVTQTAVMSAGWSYLRVPDPGHGQYTLTRAVRSDGVQIYFNTNVWTTDRTFIGMGQQPIRENILHLLDYNSPGSYTLYYTVPPPSDTTAPVSSVAALPSASYPGFIVNWNGADNSGGSVLAFFDIYASETTWLQHTPSRSALYSGNFGHSYAFYSRATDASGNAEPAPFTPQAQTTVSLSNSPPTISVISNILIGAGETLSLNVSASDPDVQDVLSFSLAPGAPPGMVINPMTGHVSWLTSASILGSALVTTNRINVVVKDIGQPQLSATGMVSVVLHQINTAPRLAAIPDSYANVLAALIFTNRVVDSDVPTNHLTFALGTSAPLGVHLNPTNGIFSWTPSRSQANSTNLISISVTDDGIPLLNDTKSFTVIVNPYLELFLGSSVLRAGETGSIPISIVSSTLITNLGFAFGYPQSRLTNWEIQPTASLSASTSGSNNMLFVSISSPDGIGLVGTQALGQMSFVAVSNQLSAFIPLVFSNAIGVGIDGAVIPRNLFNDGRATVLGTQSLLEGALATNGQRYLILYGLPGTNYILQASQSLLTPSWMDMGFFSPSNFTLPILDIGNTNSPVFYRVRQ